MFGNGVMTGMVATAAVRRLTLKARHLAPTVWPVAVAGTTMRVAVVCRVVTSALQTAGASTAASALSFRNYNYNP